MLHIIFLITCSAIAGRDHRDPGYFKTTEITSIDRHAIAGMGVERLLELHQSLGRYIVGTFKLPDNEDLMQSCGDLSTEPIVDETQAAASTIGALRLELYEQHRPKVADQKREIC